MATPVQVGETTPDPVSGVASRHPHWRERKPEWDIVRDCYDGTDVIKDRRHDYLPMPSGFTAQADSGREMFDAYSARAQFPELFAPTVNGMVGLIHRKEVQIEMPDAMLGIWERATPDGLTLEALHRRITAEILTTGRHVLFVDAPTEGTDIPWIATYRAEELINWDDENRQLFVLDETGLVRDGDFEWKRRNQYRALRINDGGRYEVSLYSGENLMEPTEVMEPKARANVPLEEIPLVIVGTRDLAVEPDRPPLAAVARASLAIYRLDADYRHQLFMTGQETLFVIGVDAKSLPTVIGAGVVHGLPQGADAKYVGPSGRGIEAHRNAIKDEEQKAINAGARMLDSATREAESGDALELRFAAQTASLASVSMASSAALERALRYVAIFMGLDPGAVIVKPNLEFVNKTMSAAEASELVKSWQAGAISYPTLYENLQRGGIASPERTHEDERELIDAEPIDEPIVEDPDEVPDPVDPGNVE